MFGLALIISFSFGFVSLSYEIIWIRVYSYVSGSSPVVFGLLLGFYLIGLAVGSFIVTRFCKNDDKYKKKYLSLITLYLFLANIIGLTVLPFLSFLSTKIDWWYTLPLVSIAAAMFGSGLPLISHYSIKADKYSGSNLSYIYMINIFGSAFGSLITGFLFLNIFTIKDTASILAILGMAIVSCLIIITNINFKNIATSIISFTIFSLLIFLISEPLFNKFYEKLQYKKGYTSNIEFSDVIENRSGVITVHNRTVYGHGAYDGVISTDLIDDRNSIVRAFAMLGMHKSPKNVLIIGLGSGSWSKVISSMSNVKKVTIVEINPGYVELISRYKEVSSILDNQKVEIIIDDARRWLNNNPNTKFDFIVANTTWHWRAHATNVLSIEFINLIKKHLNPKGIYYFNTTNSKEAMKTAISAFDYGFRVMNCLAVSDSYINFSKKRWRKALINYTINDKKIIDKNNPKHIKRLKDILKLDHTKNRTDKNLNKKLRNVGIITDNNMLSEFKKIVLQPY